MTKKKSEPKKSGPCPVNCTKIKLKMDCSSHPPGLPFPDREKPNGWQVKPHARCGVKNPEQMRKEFSKGFSKKENIEIPPQIQAWAKEQYGIEVKYGEELIDTMTNMGLKPQMHHKLPVMLGGDDIADNYIPIPMKDHQKAYGGVHKWWDKKLRGMEGDLERKLGKCNKYSKNKKEKALHDCARTKRGYMRKTCEGQLTNISGCLDKQGIKLYVDCGP